MGGSDGNHGAIVEPFRDAFRNIAFRIRQVRLGDAPFASNDADLRRRRDPGQPPQRHDRRGAGNDFVDGAAGADTIGGSSDTDELQGGSGNDFFLLGSIGSATVDGGAGTDSVSYSLSGDIGPNALFGNAGNDVLRGEAEPTAWRVGRATTR